MQIMTSDTMSSYDRSGFVYSYRMPTENPYVTGALLVYTFPAKTNIKRLSITFDSRFWDRAILLYADKMTHNMPNDNRCTSLICSLSRGVGRGGGALFQHEFILYLTVC